MATSELKLSNVENTNYAASMHEIQSIERVPGYDRLLCTVINERMYIIDESYKVGDIVVTFPSGCKINPEFLSYINAFRHANLNINTSKTGFFDDNARVKVMKFKESYSQGFIVPFDLLEKYLTKYNIQIVPTFNCEFDTIDKIQICEKYTVVKRVSGAGLGGQRAKKTLKTLIETIVPNQFKFHDKITRANNIKFRLVPGTHLNISVKYHGTSGISANVLCKKEPTRIEKIFKKLFKFNFNEYEYKNVCASRTVIKSVGDSTEKISQDYNGFDIWTRCHNQIKDHLLPGMTMYYEIVGYVPSSKLIQKGYDYGCVPPTPTQGDLKEYYVLGQNYKIIVYRIKTTDPSGNTIEYPMSLIKEYINKIGVDGIQVPEILYDNYLPEVLDVDDNQYGDYFYKEFANNKEWGMEQDCPYCKNKVPFEGVVIRFEGRNLYDAFKLKCKKFDKFEDEQLDKGESNIEDEN